MSTSPFEYLVISRGQWDPHATPDEIQAVIEAFYDWYGRELDAGRMRAGQRLAREGKGVSRNGIVDGPFAEAKEVVGGYWFILAGSLDEAAAIAAGNPCLALGLSCEVRPIEAARASAFARASETPAA